MLLLHSHQYLQLTKQTLVNHCWKVSQAKDTDKIAGWLRLSNILIFSMKMNTLILVKWLGSHIPYLNRNGLSKEMSFENNVLFSASLNITFSHCVMLDVLRHGMWNTLMVWYFTWCKCKMAPAKRNLCRFPMSCKRQSTENSTKLMQSFSSYCAEMDKKKI